jgi:hypothetical protein
VLACCAVELEVVDDLNLPFAYYEDLFQASSETLFVATRETVECLLTNDRTKPCCRIDHFRRNFNGYSDDKFTGRDNNYANRFDNDSTNHDVNGRFVDEHGTGLDDHTSRHDQHTATDEHDTSRDVDYGCCDEHNARFVRFASGQAR